MTIPITFSADRSKAEEILLNATKEFTLSTDELEKDAVQAMRSKYFVKIKDLKTRVYYRITDNWLELTVRFVCNHRGVRELKDKIAREILSEFDKFGIGIASATYDIVGLPTLNIESSPPTEKDK